MSPWGLLDEVNMFRLRTILAILLVGAMASGPAAVAASNGNVPANPLVRWSPPSPPLQCCRTHCPVCPPGKACPMYCVRVCTHC